MIECLKIWYSLILSSPDLVEGRHWTRFRTRPQLDWRIHSF